MKKNKRICHLILIMQESIPKLETVYDVSQMRCYIRYLFNMKKIDAAMYEKLQVLCDEQEAYIDGYG